jgi:hypothetical protein
MLWLYILGGAGLALGVFLILAYLLAPLGWHSLAKFLDATYRPGDEAVAQHPAGPQINPVVEASAGGCWVSFGEGRTLTGFDVALVQDGEEWGTSSGEGGRQLARCDFETSAVSDALGAGTRYTWGLATPQGKQLARVTATYYPEEAALLWSVTLLAAVEGCTTGKRTPFCFTTFTGTVAGPTRRVFAYRTEVFAPPIKRLHGRVTQGPILLYDNALQGLVMGPADHFMHAYTGLSDDGILSHGLEGTLAALPAGTEHRVLLVWGTGVNQTLVRWGTLLRRIHGTSERPVGADPFIGGLGYWTDNGAYYYYRSERGQTYERTLLGAKRVFDQRGIPFQYFQLDSWWYRKIQKPEWRRPPKAWFSRLVKGLAQGGTDVWDGIPTHFPRGLAAFRQDLGLPLAAHARWFSPESSLVPRYDWELSDFGAVPLEQRFWDDLMTYCVENGIKHYEQDWIISMYNRIPVLRTRLGLMSQMLSQMGAAAQARGITIQYCMAPPGAFLESVRNPAVTNARTGGDYWARAPKTFFVPDITQANLLCWALGIYPSADVFYSRKTSVFTEQFLYRERYPELMALVSVLGAGPVCVGDRAARVDGDLLRQTCTSTGDLVQPDRPLTPNDVMFRPHRKPYLMDTETTLNGFRWHYLLACNLWPRRCRDFSVSPLELGWHDGGVLYDYHSHRCVVVGQGDPIPLPPKTMRLKYCVLAPWLAPGIALIGCPSKFVTVGRRLFNRVVVTHTRVEVDVRPDPEETLPVLFYVAAGTPRVWVDGVSTAVEEAANQLTIQVPARVDTVHVTVDLSP